MPTAPKTQKNTASVSEFIAAVADETRRNDCLSLLCVMQEITNEKPAMWGDSIIGFGTYRYKSPTTTREGEWFMIGFAPRKQNLTIYILPGFEAYSELLKKLGKHKTSSGSCLLINKLADVDMKVLEQLITESYNYMKTKFSLPTKKTKQ